MRDILEDINSKLLDLGDFKTLMNNWRLAGDKMVFTNGVFDLIHPGHITYLAKAAELGDRLVIGLNSDASVRRLKGDNRPVNGQDARALLLAAFSFTSAILIFDEDTPEMLIKALKPDVLVKGADYKIEQIAGAADVLANGGEVKTIEFVDGHSSTAIISKIIEGNA